MNICCFIPLRNIYLLVRLALRILGCGAVSLPEAQISNDDDNKSILAFDSKSTLMKVEMDLLVYNRRLGISSCL